MIDEVLFLRHGRTAYNLARRLQGQIDIPLDIVGRWQADQSAYELAKTYYWAKVAHLAEHNDQLAQPAYGNAHLADVDEINNAPAAARRMLVVSSDLFRAQQTAHAFADQPGLGYLHGGEYSGFDIDVAKYVAKTLGYAEKQIVFKQLSPAMRASALTDGTVDMVVDSFSMDGTHDGEADVAGPYLTVREALLVRSDSASEITGTDSLSDKTVCAVAGSAADDNIRNRTKNTRTTVAERDTYPQCMTALMIGEADAVAADDAISAGLASNNTGDHLKIVDVPDTTWSYGIAVKSGQDELVGQIDAALRAMVKDGSWQKAAADMGKSIGYTPDASMNPPKATAKAPSSGASAASEK